MHLNKKRLSCGRMKSWRTEIKKRVEEHDWFSKTKGVR